MNKCMITKKTTIEFLVEQYPKSIEFLSLRKIRCIRCGETIWGTIEDAAKEKGYSDIEIDKIIEDLLVFLKEENDVI